MQFRNDINGLRGLAVVAVVLYHFGVAGLHGGYAGVDIFFVISGFLMTQIIMTGIETRRFSIAGFYASRAKRIIPALAALCMALLIFGYAWLIPSDFETLGKHIAGAISFTSNFIFRGGEGYFDAPVRDTWLLHTWSLSVEWQFYILYPLMLLGWAKYSGRSRRKLLWLFGILAVASALCAILVTPVKPNISFYLLPARVWEFLAGAAICLLPRPVRHHARMEWLGLLMMFASFFVFNDATPWPGYATALPVAGAALFIYAARTNPLLLGTAPFQALGKMSYSIYLWHWPIFVGLGYFALGGNQWAPYLGVAASILLGALSYLFIETPTRQKMKRWTHRRTGIVFTLLVLVMAGAGVAIFKSKGLPGRVPEVVARADAAANDKYKLEGKCTYGKRTKETTRCYVGEGEGVNYAIWGDSHSGAISSAVSAAARSRGVLYLAFCPTIFGAEIGMFDEPRCARFNEMIFEDIKKLPKNVPLIIVNRYANYLDRRGEVKDQRRFDLVYPDTKQAPAKMEEKVAIYQERLVESLCRIAATRKTYVMKPIPEMRKDVPRTYARALLTGRPAEGIAITTEEYAERNRDILKALETARKHCGITLLDPLPAYCAGGACNAVDAGNPLYFDNNHLNESGNKKLLPVLRPVFSR